MITIYHNPRCSKSRAALALAEQFADAQGLALTIVDYQKTPLTLAQLSALQQQLGGAAGEMVRDNEDEYAALQLAQADEAALLRALAAHPRLLQRPIVSYRGRAVIGRPTERVLDLLQAKSREAGRRHRLPCSDWETRPARNWPASRPVVGSRNSAAALGLGDTSGGRHERGELRIADFGAVDPARLDLDASLRSAQSTDSTHFPSHFFVLPYPDLHGMMMATAAIR